MACALPIALLAVRRRNGVTTLLERATYAAHVLPGVVIGLAMVSIGVRLVPSLYQTTLILIVAYAVLFLPRAVVPVTSAVHKAPVVLDEVARSLGRRPVSVACRVTIPLVAPGLGAAAALVFLSVVNELTATLMLAPAGTQTLATRVWSQADALSFGSAAPYAALMVTVSIPAMLVLMSRFGGLGGGKAAQ